jgi:hypothetical protein
METGKFDDTSKQKSLTAKLRSSELITAYDLDEEQQRSKNRQELVTFADWLQMEYKISDLDIYPDLLCMLSFNVRLSRRGSVMCVFIFIII